MTKLGLSAPWQTYYRELQELFKDNIGIKVIFDEENYEIKVYASNPDTAAALAKLLPAEKEFGTVKLTITVIPPNDDEAYFKAVLSEERKPSDLIKDAFLGNDAVSYFWDVSNVIPGLDILYVVFVNKVVQYYSDTLSDPHGLTSTLYENIAKNVFDVPGVFFSTDISNDV